MKELTYFNGEFVEPGAKVISIDDRGYLFGDSVYEVVRVTKGRCFALSYHQDRLYLSLIHIFLGSLSSNDAPRPITRNGTSVIIAVGSE